MSDIEDEVTWTARWERKLQRSWSEDDELLLNAADKRHEDPLWAISYTLFGIYPPDILPKGFRIDVTNNSTIETKDGRLLSNTNWSQNICVELSKLVKCPAFYRDLPFLRHVIKYVVFLRCKDEGQQKPPAPDCSRDLADEIIRGMALMFTDERIGMKLEGAAAKIQEQIEARYGNGDHPHLGLIEALEKVVKRGYHKNSSGLTLKDLSWILKAWTAYAESKGLPNAVIDSLHRKGAFPKDKMLRNEAIKMRAFDFDDAKRSYIMDLRRQAVQSAEGWTRGARELFGEAFELGKHHAISQEVLEGRRVSSYNRMAIASDSAMQGIMDDCGGEDRGGDSVHGSDSFHGSDHVYGSDHSQGSVRIQSSPGADDPTITATLKRQVSPGNDIPADKRQRIEPMLRNGLAHEGVHVAIPSANLESARLFSFSIPCTATPTEATKIIWGEMAPGFAVTQILSGEQDYSRYSQGLAASTLYCDSTKGLELWEAITKGIRTKLLEEVCQSIDDFRYIEEPSEDLDLVIRGIRTNLFKLRERLGRFSSHHRTAERLRAADVEIISGPARQPGGIPWDEMGLPIQYVEPQDVREKEDDNEYAFDTRPGASRRWAAWHKFEVNYPTPKRSSC